MSDTVEGWTISHRDDDVRCLDHLWDWLNSQSDNDPNAHWSAYSLYASAAMFVMERPTQ